MSLIRHIAGVPTATEQRCVRCCEVIKDKRLMCVWPGTSFLMMGKRQPIVEWDYPGSVDCVAYDPHAGGEMTEAERQELVVRYDPHGSRELTQTERQDLVVRHGGERQKWMR